MENEFNLEKIKTQEALWDKIKNINNSGDIPPSTVIGLLVKDPRIILPKKKLFNTVKEQNKKNSKFKLDDGKRLTEDLTFDILIFILFL